MRNCVRFSGGNAAIKVLDAIIGELFYAPSGRGIVNAPASLWE